MTDSDSDGGSYTSDSLIRSGSAGTSSTIKPIKEGYLTKKGALVSKIQLTYKSFKFGTFFFEKIINTQFKPSNKSWTCVQ